MVKKSCWLPLRHRGGSVAMCRHAALRDLGREQVVLRRFQQPAGPYPRTIAQDALASPVAPYEAV